MEESEQYKTYKLRISFDIDVPNDIQTSNLNTVVIQLHELRNYISDKHNNCIEPEVVNNTIDKIKNTLDNMKYSFL